MRQNGRAGSTFSFRGLKSERAINYKLRATWLTPEVVRATARLAQLRSVLPEEETLRLVREAEEIAQTVFLVEIDPKEGSGVVPRDWIAILQAPVAGQQAPLEIPGTKRRSLGRIKALAGTHRRDYAYERFWVSFPLVSEDGSALIPPDAGAVELLVRIRTQAGGIAFSVPASIRERAAALGAARIESGPRGGHEEAATASPDLRAPTHSRP